MGGWQSYEGAYIETDTKVCIVRNHDGSWNPKWSYRRGGRVPSQLAGRLSQQQWTQFLAELEDDMPRSSGYEWSAFACLCLAPIGVVIGTGVGLFVCVSLFALPAIFCRFVYIGHTQRSFIADLVRQHEVAFYNVGVHLSYQSEPIDSENHIEWIQLAVVSPAQPQGAAASGCRLVNVTVPPGYGPGSHITVAAPTGERVSVVVPVRATAGSTFQISMPSPVVPTPVRVMVAMPVVRTV